MLPAARLREVNASLAKTPYRGLVVACPYTPLSAERGAGSAEPFARFVVSVLLPKVAELKGGGVMRDGTGIDGISMGGRYALLVGFAHPDVFGAVGAMQPAIAAGEVDSIADLARSAGARRPQRVRLVSSQGDPFLGVTRALADALEVRGVAHRLVVTDGPHDYAWNRGPGGIELAVFHERALRGLDPP
jgi:enterochelin esterase-like enzyme